MTDLDRAIRCLSRRVTRTLLDDDFRLLPRRMRRRIARKFYGRGKNRQPAAPVCAVWTKAQLDELSAELEAVARRRGMILAHVS